MVGSKVKQAISKIWRAPVKTVVHYLLKAHVGRIDFAPSGIGMGHSGLAARRASERGQATNYAGSSRVRLRRASWYTP